MYLRHYTYIIHNDDESTFNMPTKLSRFERYYCYYEFFFILILVFSSFLAFPPQRNDVCSRTNIAFSILSYHLLFLFLSRKYTNVIIAMYVDRKECVWRNRMFSLSLFFSSSDWIKKRIHKAKNFSIERHSRLFLSLFNNLEQLFELVVVRIKWDITSILKTVCSFSLVLFFDSYLDYICIFCFFFLIQSAVQIHIYEEVTLNGPWTVMMLKGTVYIYIKQENERRKIKKKK